MVRAVFHLELIELLPPYSQLVLMELPRSEWAETINAQRQLFLLLRQTLFSTSLQHLFCALAPQQLEHLRVSV